MPNNLTVVFGLTRKAKGRISLFLNLFVGHHLNSLRRVRQFYAMRRHLRDLAIHERGPRVKLMEKRVLDRADIHLVFDWVRPDPGNLPNVDLSIGNNIAACGRKVPNSRESECHPPTARHKSGPRPGRKARSSQFGFVRVLTALRRKGRSIAMGYSAAIRSASFALSSGSRR